jgi:hypothetical protein
MPPWAVAGVGWVGYVKIVMRAFLLFSFLLVTTSSSVLAQTVRDELTHQVSNMSYYIPLAEEWLTLHDGEYKSPGPQLDCCYLSLEQVAYGDLNGDDLTDAAVILVWAEGNGVAYHVVAVLAGPGTERRARATYLDHAIGLDSLWVDPGGVHVTMTRHLYDDPTCCPSLHLTNSYVLDEDQTLVELDPDPREEEAIGILKQLFVLSWQFEKEAGSTVGFTEDWATQNYYEYTGGYRRADEPPSRFEYEPRTDISIEIDSTTEDLIIAAHHACSVWSYVATGYKEFERIRFEGAAPDRRCEEHQ